MALTCQAGFYYDDRTEECRNCDYVCGDQYGGREGLECIENCPAYGISTTYAPANDIDKVVWILVPFTVLVIIMIVTMAIICFKKGRCLWKPQTKTIVHEESKEGLTAKSASTFEPV